MSEVEESYLALTCKVGKGADCCRYVTMGGTGWKCAKLDGTLKPIIDWRVSNNTMKAQGDNCEGVDDLQARSNGIDLATSNGVQIVAIEQRRCACGGNPHTVTCPMKPDKLQ